MPPVAVAIGCGLQEGQQAEQILQAPRQRRASHTPAGGGRVAVGSGSRDAAQAGATDLQALQTSTQSAPSVHGIQLERHFRGLGSAALNLRSEGSHSRPVNYVVWRLLLRGKWRGKWRKSNTRCAFGFSEHLFFFHFSKSKLPKFAPPLPCSGTAQYSAQCGTVHSMHSAQHNTRHLRLIKAHTPPAQACQRGGHDLQGRPGGRQQQWREGWQADLLRLLHCRQARGRLLRVGPCRTTALLQPQGWCLLLS